MAVITSRYAVTVTECRFGWTAKVGYGEGWMDLLDPPTFWRPTWAWAFKAATRLARRWAMQDVRERQALTIPVSVHVDGPTTNLSFVAEP